MKPLRECNYYELLEVPTRASTDEIRAAYDRILKASGVIANENGSEPGAGQSNGWDQRLELHELIGRALSVLTDPEQRAGYDRLIRPIAVDSASTESQAATQLSMDGLLESAVGPRLATLGQRVSYRPRGVLSPPEPWEPAGRVGPLNGEAPGGSKTLTELGDAPPLAEESAIANAEAALLHASVRGHHLRNRPVEIAPNADFNGELLRQVREGKGMGIQQVAERTRIPVKHLENIEADRYNHLPPTVYLRGILTNLSRELGLDPMRVTRSYIALAAEAKAKGR
ncbi:MAG TPA: helix-turn-helix domain-containing protein [Myxococcaceae bacterium]|nr:helix-turn-helix domain-containing protein [Myxococcaceae bacterium]